MNLLELPNVMLIEIFEFLPYEEASKKRLVCRRIDQICQHVLNCGFNRVMRQHSISFKRIKALLPRRESERRNHCLARHADILTSIETRISMLSMTYSKYMDLNLCCFIPGRVLDEINRILRLIAKTTIPLRPHEVLQELRDISSMAIEHFDEKIANTFKKSYGECSSTTASGSCGKSSSGCDKNRLSSVNCLTLSLACSSSPPSGGYWSSTMASTLRPPSPPTGGAGSFASNSQECCDSIRQRVNTLLSLGQTWRNIKKTNAPMQLNTVEESLTAEEEAASGSSSQQHRNCPDARATMSYFKKLEVDYKRGIAKMRRMQSFQINQSRRLQQAQTAIAELNMQVIELKKRLEDVDAKNREISANIKQINSGEPPAAAGIAAPLETAAVAAVVIGVIESPPPATVKCCFEASGESDSEKREFSIISAGESVQKISQPLTELLSPSDLPSRGGSVSPLAITGVGVKRQHESGDEPIPAAIASSTSSCSTSIQAAEEAESEKAFSAKRPKL